MHVDDMMTFETYPRGREQRLVIATTSAVSDQNRMLGSGVCNPVPVINPVPVMSPKELTDCSRFAKNLVMITHNGRRDKCHARYVSFMNNLRHPHNDPTLHIKPRAQLILLGTLRCTPAPAVALPIAPVELHIPPVELAGPTPPFPDGKLTLA